jgi:hypothetical protein
VEADTLTIEGEIDLEMPGGMEASHAEVSLPRYRRVFTLSKELDASKVSAEFRNGVLKARDPQGRTRATAQGRGQDPVRQQSLSVTVMTGKDTPNHESHDRPLFSRPFSRSGEKGVL